MHHKYSHLLGRVVGSGSQHDDIVVLLLTAGIGLRSPAGDSLGHVS
jgi:hypothetical protein